ncbi:MAG: hypothetical protein ACFB4J_20175 [Elainellaceae cyanobacterium]
MDLDQQIQTLIDSAPEDGVTPTMMAMIAPVIKAVAAQLVHPQYYLLQTIDDGWLMTTLSHRAQATVEKNVVYAYPTLEDARSGSRSARDPQITALPVPVTHILFQMLAMKVIHSIIFLRTSNNLQDGIEVSRERLEQLIKHHVQTIRSQDQPSNKSRTDIA